MTLHSGISIFLLAYGQNVFLPQCASSLSDQSWGNFQVICYVDPDDQGSRSILENYQESDWRFRVCPVNQQAFSEEINRELESTRSEYVVFLKPGDLCQKQYLESGMKLAEQYSPQLVLFDSGCREIRYGTLRKDLHMLKRQNCPADEVFSPKDIKGNHLSVVQKPTRLTLFRTAFLREKGIYWHQTGYGNDLYIGRCALARAERVCAVREQQAFLYRGRTEYQTEKAETELFCQYLQTHGLWEAEEQFIVQALLSETAAALRLVNNDATRYGILEELEKPLYARYLEKPAAWFRFLNAGKEAQFLANARNRYRITKQAKTPRPEEQLVYTALDFDPAVSVILPVYNTEKYVEEAVRSLLGQTLRELEIICYDDGSTDESLKILLRLAEEDPRIQVYHQENCGLSISRNRAIQHAKGEYLYFMDSDDILMPNAMEAAYTKATHEELDLVLFNAENFYDESNLIGEKKNREGRLFFQQYKGIMSGAEMLLKRHNHYEANANVWLGLVCRDFLIREQISFVEGIYYEDVAYSYEVQLKAKRAAYIDEVFYRRRIRKEAITTMEKSLDHSYGVFRALLKMQMVYRETEGSLTEAQRDAARSRMKTVLNSGRNLFLETYDRCYGEEYGLGDDSVFFRSLISSYCEQEKMVLSYKKESEDLQNRLEENTKS